MTRSEKVSNATSVLSLLVAIAALLYAALLDNRREADSTAHVVRNAFVFGERLGKDFAVATDIATLRPRAPAAAGYSEAWMETRIEKLRHLHDNLALSTASWSSTDVLTLITNSREQISAKHGALPRAYFDLGLDLGKVQGYFAPDISPHEGAAELKALYMEARKRAIPLGYRLPDPSDVASPKALTTAVAELSMIIQRKYGFVQSTR